MNNKKYIEELCRSKTFLDDSSINKIIDLSYSLQTMADFNEADMFIDVLSRDKNSAIVVCHARPNESESIYIDKVIGEEALRKNEPGVLKTLETAVPCSDIKAINQENKIVKQKIKPIKNDNNEVIGVIIQEKDISSKVEKNFNIGDESKHLLNLIGRKDINSMLANNLDDGIFIFDKNGVLVIKNSNAVNIYNKLGYFQGIDYDTYDNLALDNKKFNDLIKELEYKNSIIKEISFGDYDLKVKWIHIPENSKLKLICIIKDITDIKNKEKQMKLKDIEIREAHHRIKNNLQATAAFLRTESRRCTNEYTKYSLDESISRILTIASTHDLLSKSGNNTIKAKEAILSIIGNVDSLESKDININIIGDDFEVYGDKATALLLAINEIIVNCYKHGFKDIQKGKLQVYINKVDDYITIKISNDGNKFNSKCKEATGLGMGIINMYIVEVLKGKIDVKSTEEITETIIKFKLKNKINSKL